MSMTLLLLLRNFCSTTGIVNEYLIKTCTKCVYKANNLQEMGHEIDTHGVIKESKSPPTKGKENSQV